MIDPHEALTDEVLLFPEAGTNVAAPHGAGRARRGPLRRLRGRRHATSSSTSGSRRARWRPRRRGRVATTAADRLVLHAERAGRRGRGRGRARASSRADPRHRPGRRRRLRREDRRRPGVRFSSPGSRSELGGPVRWTETRTENMIAMPHGRAQLQTSRSAAPRRQRARLPARRPRRTRAPTRARRLPADLHAADGARRVRHPAGRVRGHAVVTNTTPIAAYRGAGRPEATAAIERAMDLFAAEIGMDPAEVRRRNLIADDEFPLTTKSGAHYDSGEYAKAPSTRRSTRPATPTCAPSRPARASAATRPARHRRVRPTSRSPSRRRGRARRGRGAPRTARPPSSPARPRTARGTRRPGRCSRASSSASRREDHRQARATPT